MTPPLESLVKNPTVLLAPRRFLFPDETREDAFEEALQRFTQRVDLLTDMGCAVRVLGATADTKYSHGSWRFLGEFDQRKPGTVLRFDVSMRKDMLAMLWPRDVFQVYGSMVMATPGYEQTTEEILSQLGIPSGSVEIVSSQLGQGGYVVRDQQLLVLSEKVHSDKGIARLQDLGYDIYFLPVPKKEDRSTTLARRIAFNYHIDTEFNFVLATDGTPLMCVNEEYYHCFGTAVDALVRTLRGKLHILPEDSVEYRKEAVNFITLPGNKVMLPDNCVNTQRFLEQGLGTENFVVAPIDLFSDYVGPSGGLRCMSNVI